MIPGDCLSSENVALIASTIDTRGRWIDPKSLTLHQARGTVRKPVSGHFSAVVTAMVR
jgi:hypothetical protein